MTTVTSKRRPAESPAPNQRTRRSARQAASAVAESPPHSTPQVAAREATRGIPSYLLESPHEGARLDAKTDADAAAQQLSRTGLRAGMRALDVGCGTGAVTRVMAELAVPGRVTGVDISRSRLTQARQLATEQDLAIDFVEGDALHLPLPSAAFDYTWTRFLFEYLPDPEQALAELIRVTRPGGIVAVADLDSQLDQRFPIDGVIARTIQEGLRLLGETGFDPRVGRKLYHWCYQAGLRDIAVHAMPYQVYAGALPEGARLIWREKLANATQHLIDLTGDRARWERFRDDYLAQLERPDTFSYRTLILVHGTVPSRRDEAQNNGNTHDRRGTRAEGQDMAVIATDSRRPIGNQEDREDKKRAISTGIARPRRAVRPRPKGNAATTLTLRELALPTLTPRDLTIGSASYRVQRVDWRDAVRQSAYQRLRAEIFVHHLGWTLPLDDGRERDRYDRAHNDHISVHTVSGLDESGAEHLLVGVRIFRLRTWDDAMLMHEFVDIGMIDGDVIQHLTGRYDARHVLELTRLCVRPGRWYTVGSNRYNLAVARDLCYASVYALAEQGDQQHALAIVDSTMHRIMRGSHFAMETVFERDANSRHGYAVNVVDLAGTLQALRLRGASERADRFVTLCHGRFARLSPELVEM